MTRKGRHPRKVLEEESSESEENSYESPSEASDQSGSEPERVFCKCGGPNTKNMIGCDGLGCPYEWLHFGCAGIDPKKIPKGKWLCWDCQNKQDAEEEPEAPSGQFVWPTTNSDKENDSGKADPIIERSLNQAEVQLASNLKQACDAVICKGTSVSVAAQMFGIGRYVLSDCVNDQLKRNLTKACHSVMDKKYSVEKAAAAFNVIPGILKERVKAVKNSQCMPDGRRIDSHSSSSTSFEENLQQACIAVVLDQFTINKASKTYNVPPAMLKNKLQSVQALTTEEENDLVKMCIRMTVLGQSADIKSTVMSKIKQLLDEEETRGIRRLHSFTNNRPDDFWWDTFRKRHPEFKAIGSCDASQSKELVSSQSNPAASPDYNPVPSKVIVNQFVMQTKKQGSEILGIKPLTPSPQRKKVSSNVILKPLSTKSTIQNSDQTTIVQLLPPNQSASTPSGIILKTLPTQSVAQISGQNNTTPLVSAQSTLVPSNVVPKPSSTHDIQRELMLKPSTTNQIYYILSGQMVAPKQVVVVKQGTLPASQVTPCSEAIPVANIPEPAVSNQPGCVADVNQSPGTQQKRLDSSNHVDSLTNPNLVNEDINWETRGGDKVEIGDAGVVVAAEKVTKDEPEISNFLKTTEEATEVSEFLISEMEQTNAALDRKEVILPSLEVGSNEVVETDKTVSSEAAQNFSEGGAQELPQISAMGTDDDGDDETLPTLQVGTELSLPRVINGSGGAGQIGQVVSNEVVETSPASCNTVTLSDCIVTQSGSLHPLTGSAHEDSSGVTGDVIQPGQPTGPNGTPVAAKIARPSTCIVAANVATTQPNPALPAPQFVEPNMCAVANPVLQPSLVSSTPILVKVANQTLQPGRVILSKNIIRQNSVVGSNQILPQNCVVTASKVVQSDPVKNVLTTDAITMPIIGTNSGISFKKLSMHHSATEDNKHAPSVIPLSTGPKTEKPLPQFQVNSNGNNSDSHASANVFVAKGKVDKSLPDAITCLEKMLTDEQKQSFTFRLQIGDDRRDDALYNAWKALKRLYQHKNIYAMYNKKAPHRDKVPSSFDLPMATNLLHAPLMDPVNRDDSLLAKETKGGQKDCQPGSDVVAELRRGRKRRRISAVLARRDAERCQDSRRFLEPWKYQIKIPSKRKCFLARRSVASLSEEGQLHATTENQDLQMEEESLEDVHLL
ncbi:uncharacterized protein LOC110985947 isoform X2 [Acanthaster planci]|uniref:Uncharacterized protein LOC110985947 isoform X2 n=1 Tax=Acanthaster planci TaxID=133434 RepID=A0A8B7ZIN0_ACAPL|nr:uncharacterized protein LOC110985947 isoform X2 [Acanthaster planci]